MFYSSPISIVVDPFKKKSWLLLHSSFPEPEIKIRLKLEIRNIDYKGCFVLFFCKRVVKREELLICSFYQLYIYMGTPPKCNRKLLRRKLENFNNTDVTGPLVERKCLHSGLEDSCMSYTSLNNRRGFQG